ncbi:MAG TPA: MFS transporter [Solirubrobacteraceae bacterium]|jgi:MFS family permease|nr:MFS transporter [Solirubrobacteraceae bacterium]
MANPKHDVNPTSGSSAWAPFRSRDFASMASAQFVSNIGGWMQTVGAQELMLTLTTSATFVAFIQTAAGLPVVLLAVPAGAIGDLVDRRRLLLAAQLFMLLAALALAALALAGLLTPWVLLALIFAVGAGQTLTSPTWQTLQPELVAPEDRAQAIALGAVNQNLSRAVGPAIGGALYAATSAAALFFVNALSFIPVLGAVARWRGGARSRSAVAPEHVTEAIRAGARYVAGSPALRVILLRAGLFMVFANSIWALLPLVARGRLHLGSGGYGLLLGGVGIGAVAGAALLPRIRGRFSPGMLMGAGTLVFAAVTLALAFIRASELAALALVIGGVAWILVLSTLTSLYQTTLPGWAKARGMSYFLVVFQGGAALGSAVFGIVAQDVGLNSALLAAAAGLALVALIGVWLPFRAISPQDLLPAGDWPDPRLVGAPESDRPVLVTVEYRATPGREQELLDALHAGRYARRRTGAVSWRVWRDAADPGRVLEQFVVGSWDEHLRQHERVSLRDQERLARIDAMTDPSSPPTVTHWLAP